MKNLSAISVFLFVATFATAQNTLTLVPQPRTITVSTIATAMSDTVVSTDTIIPANELYQGTFPLQHVRHWPRLHHTDTTVLRLITPETPVFAMPARNFEVISRYGMRSGRMHTGIDLRQRPTDTIFAVFDGMVRIARMYSSYGKMVILRHGNGLETLYSHLSEIHVEPFQMVRAGESLGLAGRTGRATTDHLHFEFRFFYEHFNPELLIDFENGRLRHDRITFINGKLVLESEYHVGVY